MKATRLFEVRANRRTVREVRLVVFMDLWEIDKPKEGLFLNCYRLSWIAFNMEDPSQRVLVDAHPPIGIHIHVDQQEPESLSLETLQEALKFFEEKVEQRFGRLKEKF